MPEDFTQLDAEVSRVTFRNDDNGWTVAKVIASDSGQDVTVTGSFPVINEGQNYQLFGSWSTHPHYGKQFKVNRMVALRPSTREGITKYLSSGIIKGVGQKTAEKITDHFGEKTLDILDHDIDRLLEIESIGRKKLKAIINSWHKDKSANDVMMFLSEHGVSPHFSHKILTLYGYDAIKVVSKNPYRLASDIIGIGFRSADQIALRIGITEDSLERIEAAVQYQLKTSEDLGHCYLTTSQLLEELQKTLNLEKAQIEPVLLDCINILEQSCSVFSETITTEEGNDLAHYRATTYIAEVDIAQKIKQLTSTPLEIDSAKIPGLLESYAQRNELKLNEKQTAAVVTAASNRVFILTGGPGVGKTTTANTIIQLFQDIGKTIALCAPTGRAAQRLSEVSSVSAKTIHRILEWMPHLNDFEHNAENPLTAEVIIVDEASMLDVHLAAALLRAVPSRAQIIFIGDVDQLPSVGPGNVLRDLIQSNKVPYCELTDIFRQKESSQIIQVAHSINKGEAPQFDIASDCKFIEVENPEHIRGVIKALVKDKIPTECGFDPIQDIQVLTPMNRGDLGTETLNEDIQDLINPKTPGKEESKKASLVLRTGDKVIQTINNYDLKVFNGDIGIVLHCGVDRGKTIVQFGDRNVTYKSEEVRELKLAYAITIHKSQGSEFPVVIIPISNQHYIMLQRNLIYTALTRAKKLAVFVGTTKALSYAIRNQRSKTRQTQLRQKICESST